MDLTARNRQVMWVLWVTLALNVAVALAKLLCAEVYGSLSLRADGYHSLSDGLSNVVGLVGMWLAMKPPDEEHPYGHRKFELAVAFAIAISLFWVAFHIVTEALGRWRGMEPVEASLLPFVVMIATILVNVGVSRYERRMGELLASPLLASDSAHTGSDVYASLAVLGSLAASAAGIRHVDLVAAVGIALLVAWQGYKMVSRTASLISDERVIDRVEVEKVACSFAEVKACHRVRSRGIADDVFLDLHLLVDPAMPVREAHDLSHRVEAALKGRFPGLHDVTIHLEPEGDPED